MMNLIMMKTMKIMYCKRTKKHDKFLKIPQFTLPCIGNLTQNLKTHGAFAHINLLVPKWKLLGDLVS